tara:strand:+ start:958 stop:1287 length:330 start_codon:yes stop_codon:yes gene_type:complete
MKKLYCVLIEVIASENSQLPQGCAGAFVSIYLCANDIIEAIMSAENALQQDCYKPINTSSAYQVEIDELETNRDNIDIPQQENIENLMKNGGVWYGTFHTFPPEKKSLN